MAAFSPVAFPSDLSFPLTVSLHLRNRPKAYGLTEARSAALPMAQGLLPLGRCRGLLLTLHSLPRRHWQWRRRGGRGGAAAGGCRQVRACLARLEAAQPPEVGRGVRRAASTLARARLVGWEPGGMGACKGSAPFTRRGRRRDQARSGEKWWPQASSGAGPFRRAVVASALAQASPRGAPAPEAEIRAHFQPARRAAQRGVVPRVVRAARAVR